MTHQSPVTLSRAILNPTEGTLTLCFTGLLDAQSAQQVTHYGVAVNKIILNAIIAQLQGGDTVVLRLPVGSLTPECHVVAWWEGVLDASGLALRGRQEIITS